MKPSSALRLHRDAVVSLIAQYRLRNPKLFGSAARGSDRETSDVDILVEPGEDVSFYDLAELEEKLGSLLGCRVDIVTPGGLARDVFERIRPDLMPL